MGRGSAGGGRGSVLWGEAGQCGGGGCQSEGDGGKADRPTTKQVCNCIHTRIGPLQG